MISQNEKGKKPGIQSNRGRPYRLLPGLWTSVCVISVVSLSLMLFTEQQRKNASLEIALKAQSIELLTGSPSAIQ